MKLKPLFSTEQLLRNEVTPAVARADSITGTFRRNAGTKPIRPTAKGQGQTSSRK